MVFFFKCKQQSTSLIDNNSVTENNTNAQQDDTQQNNEHQNHHQNASSLQVLEQAFVVSTAPPKETDILKTAELVNSLRLYGILNFDELNHGLNILTKLTLIVDKWIKITLISRNIPKNIVDNASAQLYTYGNYKLWVHDKEDHISILCVTPWYINRTDFFIPFSNFLVFQPEVTNLQAIDDEVIQMKFEGINVDMFFARLPLTEIYKAIDLQDEMLLKNVDQKCFKSLYGVRVTNQILQLIPNIHEFRLVVKAIKLWAKHNGVHSNLHGFLNDAAWTLLVVRICQSYPQAVAATLIQKFFLIFSNWKWPEPVFIKKLPPVNWSIPSWDPNNYIQVDFSVKLGQKIYFFTLQANIQDRSDVMPIITPVHPQRNVALNVSISTRKIMLNAFKWASQLTEEIMLGKESWDRLFHSSSFFMKYQHYIVLMVNAETYADHLQWRSFIENEVKHLIANLEANPHIALVHINPESFSHFKLNSNSQSGYSMWFIGLEFAKTNFNLDLSYDMQNFTMETIQKARSVNIIRRGMDLTARRIKQEQLRLYIPASIINFEKVNNENLIGKQTNDNSLPAERTINKEKLTQQLQHTVNKTSDSEEEDDTDYKICLKNHGYKSLESESDDGKSESDDELRAMKPPPLAYNDFKHRIVKIGVPNNLSVTNIENQNRKTHFDQLGKKATAEDTLLPTWFIDELLHDGNSLNITNSKNETANLKEKTKDITSQTTQNLAGIIQNHNPTPQLRNYMNVIGPNLLLYKPNNLPQVGAPIFQPPYIRPSYLGNIASNWNPYLIQHLQLQQQINYQHGIRYQMNTPAQNLLFYQNKTNLPQSVVIPQSGQNLFNSNPISQRPPGIIPPPLKTQAYMPISNQNSLILQHSQQKVQNNSNSEAMNMSEHKQSILPNTPQIYNNIINNNILDNRPPSWADIATLKNTRRESNCNTVPNGNFNPPPVVGTKNGLHKDKASVDILTSDPQMFPSLQETVHTYQENEQINNKNIIENKNNRSRRRKLSKSTF
ncbi:poly a polymerase [Holotrichia oblita]|uniref:Poly a polymerase n=1 Tax=Holotrichia oblita TaxID=644536 RepID=A0ACB9TWM3_HOLOL|nr:poly a polymerase [Holotrichia oblita]